MSYGTDVTVEFPLTRMDSAGKARVERKIRQIAINGCTNLSGGLQRGVEILRERDDEDKNEVSSVLLLTDGLANEGYTAATDILRACRDPAFAAASPTDRGMPLGPRFGYRQQVSSNTFQFRATAPPVIQGGLPPAAQVSATSPDDEKVRPDDEKPANLLALPGTINTFGFSARHDPKLLQAIAEAGGGMFYFIENAEGIAEAFSDCLGGLLSTTSQRLRLTLTAANGSTIRKVHTRFDLKEEIAGAKYVVEVSDMQSEEKREVLFSVEVPDLPESMPRHDVVSLELEYYNAIKKQDESCSAAGWVSRPAEDPQGADGDVDLSVDRSFNREAAANAMDSATQVGDLGDIAKARSILTDAIGAIKGSPSRNDPFCLALVEDMEGILKNLVDRVSYETTCQKQLYTNVSSHGRQRTTAKSPMMSAQAVAYDTHSRQICSANWETYKK